jgi:hypothetical protein
VPIVAASSVEALKATWVGTSGQLWKVYVGLVWMVAAFACLLLAFVAGPDASRTFGWWMTAFVSFGVLMFAWLSVSIRCPLCRGPVMWWTASKISHASWPLTVFEIRDCPYCGGALLDGGTSARSASRRDPDGPG